MRTMRLQGAIAGLALGGVLSAPPALVLSLVTGDVLEAAATWLWVTGPLCALTTAVGVLAVGGPARGEPRGHGTPPRAGRA